MNGICHEEGDRRTDWERRSLTKGHKPNGKRKTKNRGGGGGRMGIGCEWKSVKASEMTWLSTPQLYKGLHLGGKGAVRFGNATGLGKDAQLFFLQYIMN
jgi:hypothetical protein